MSEEIPEDFVRDFKALFEDPQPIELELSKYQAWCLMATIQLAFKHPQVAESSTMRAAVMIARGLQEIVSQTPALARVAERGWTEKN